MRQKQEGKRQTTLNIYLFNPFKKNCHWSFKIGSLELAILCHGQVLEIGILQMLIEILKIFLALLVIFGIIFLCRKKKMCWTCKNNLRFYCSVKDKNVCPFGHCPKHEQAKFCLLLILFPSRIGYLSSLLFLQKHQNPLKQ